MIFEKATLSRENLKPKLNNYPVQFINKVIDSEKNNKKNITAKLIWTIEGSSAGKLKKVLKIHKQKIVFYNNNSLEKYLET